MTIRNRVADIPAGPTQRQNGGYLRGIVSEATTHRNGKLNRA
jgi:hypothetical protein